MNISRFPANPNQPFLSRVLRQQAAWNELDRMDGLMPPSEQDSIGRDEFLARFSTMPMHASARPMVAPSLLEMQFPLDSIAEEGEDDDASAFPVAPMQR